MKIGRIPGFVGWSLVIGGAWLVLELFDRVSRDSDDLQVSAQGHEADTISFEEREEKAVVEFTLPAQFEGPVSRLEELNFQTEEQIEEANRIVRETAEVWGQSDPEEALNWSSSLEPGFSRVAMDIILEKWVSADPGLALNYFEESEGISSRFRRIGYMRVLSLWSRTAPEAAFEAASKLEDLVAGNQAKQEIVQSISEKDAVQGARLLNELDLDLSSNGEFSLAFQSVATNLAIEDFDQALNWVEGLPEGSDAEISGKKHAVSALGNQWAEKDIEEFSQWLLKLPEGAIRDAGIEMMVVRDKRSEPEAALSWVNRAMSGQEGIDGWTMNIAAGWLSREGDIALEKMQKMEDLSIGQKQRIKEAWLLIQEQRDY